MKSGSEEDVKEGIQMLLDKIASGRFLCTDRKSTGKSVIGKPVDLEIQIKGASARTVLVIEVANVNTTQLVGECCRLFYDSCPLKLLILDDVNVPPSGVEQCRSLLVRLYGQNKIDDTPSRVFKYDDDDNIERALKELLLL